MFFDAQECQLFSDELGRDYALENINGCEGLTAGGYLSISELDNQVYLIILFSPLLIEAVLIAIAIRGSPVTLASFRYYFGMLALLACYVLIIGMLGLWGLLTNGYYLRSRCPDNMMETEACRFVIKNYNLGNLEIASYLTLSAAAITASVWALKIIKEGANAVDHYKSYKAT
jgi:hypothetical protein